MKKIIFTLIFVIAGCSASEDDLIGQAQLCLDRATPTEAQGCIEPIRHINKRSAQIVKCAAGFTTEGFGKGQKLLEANRRLEDSSKGSPSFLGVMTFSSKNTPEQNRAFAQEVDSYCQVTGKPVYDLLSAMSLSATTIAAGGSLNWDKNSPPNRDDVRTAITNLLATRSDPQTSETIREIGKLVLRMFTNACQIDREVNPRLCDRIESALNASGDSKDATAVGDRALEAWRQ